MHHPVVSLLFCAALLIPATSAACTSGFYYNSALQTPTCVACTGNTYCDIAAGGCPDACFACPPNTAATADHTNCMSATCVVCPQGSYCEGGTRIQGCAVGTFGGSAGLTSAGSCTACYGGTYASVIGMSVCTQCAPGQYNAARGATTCQRCVAGTYITDSGRTVCASCLPGKYGETIGASVSAACIECGAGTYSTGFAVNSATACTLCAPGSYSGKTGIGSPVCNQCNPGLYGTTSGATTFSIGCSTCPAGTYQVGWGASYCDQCTVGFYSGQAGAYSTASCNPCPTLSTTSGPAATTITACQCLPGTTPTYTNGPCAYCAPGSYKPTYGQTPCTLCAANTYDVAEYDVDPVYGTPYRTNSGACRGVPSNAYSPAGVAAFACNAGFFKTPNTLFVAYEQGDHRYLCNQCPQNYYAVANVTACSLCTNGYTGYNSIATSAGSCSCNAGFYQTGDGCAVCPPDKYCPGGDKSIKPVACRDNSYSLGGARADTDCLCRPGYAGSTSVCTLCLQGFYCEGGNSNATVACPDNSTSPVGSSSKLNCSCLPGYASVNRSSPTNPNPVVVGTACRKCDPNFVCTSGIEVPCPANSYSEQSIAQCACLAGYTNVTGTNGTSVITSKNCTLCPPGRYCPGGGPSLACPPNSTTPSWGSVYASACVCMPGFYTGTGGVCALCAGGSWCAGGTTQPCGANMQSLPGASASSQCVCNAGYAGGYPTCGTCGAGTYATAAGLTAVSMCSKCSVGTYSSALAASSTSACVACAAGTYGFTSGATSPSAACANCSSGLYSTALGANAWTTCVPCPPMMNTTQSGAADPTLCACDTGYGMYGGVCGICPAGSGKPSVSNTTCTQCDASYFDGSTAASGVDAATGRSLRTGSNCIPVPPNAFSAQGASVYSCNGGYYLTTLQSAITQNGSRPACVACGAGTYTSAAGAELAAGCIQCASGRYATAPAQTSSAACAACAAGLYSSGTGQTTIGACLPCPAGTTSTAAALPALAGCVSCAGGSYGTSSGRTTPCDTCIAGTFSTAARATSPATCTSCGYGTYSTGTGLTSACTKCAPGKYSAVLGASLPETCRDCDPGAYSGLGAASCSVCYPGTQWTPYTT